MAQTIPLELVKKLPKTDLHVHLDGSLRLETILDLAEKQGVELPSTDPQKLREAMNLGKNCGSLVEYLKAFDVTLLVLQTEESLYRAAFELAEDAAAENVRYMEVRYAPMLHTRRGLKLTSVVESVLAGLRAAQEKFLMDEGPEFSAEAVENSSNAVDGHRGRAGGDEGAFARERAF